MLKSFEFLLRIYDIDKPCTLSFTSLTNSEKISVFCMIFVYLNTTFARGVR